MPNLLIVFVIAVAAVLAAFYVAPPFGSFGVKAS